MEKSYLHLSIKSLTGNFERILVDLNNDTVLRLKKLISGLFDIPVLEQRLIFCGKEMKDEMNLYEFKLINETFIHLVKVQNEKIEISNEDFINKIDYLLDIVNNIQKNFNELKDTNDFLLDC
jgi:hypothetical protein